MKKLNILNEGQKYIAHIIDGNEFFIDFNGDKLHTDSYSHKPFWNGKELSTLDDIFNLEYIKSVDWNEVSNSIVVENQDDEVLLIQLPNSSIINNVTYDSDTKYITLHRTGAANMQVALSDLVDFYHGTHGEEIQVVVNDNKISAILLNSVVDEEHLNDALKAKINDTNYVYDFSWDYNEGLLVFEKADGTSVEIQVPTLDIISHMTYDPSNKELVIIKNDDSEFRVDISDLVDKYTGSVGAEIEVEVDEIGNIITANLLEAVIHEKHLHVDLQERIKRITKTTDQFQPFCYVVQPGQEQFIHIGHLNNIEYDLHVEDDVDDGYGNIYTRQGHDEQGKLRLRYGSLFHSDIVYHNNTVFIDQFKNSFTFSNDWTGSLYFHNNTNYDATIKGMIINFPCLGSFSSESFNESFEKG